MLLYRIQLRANVTKVKNMIRKQVQSNSCLPACAFGDAILSFATPLVRFTDKLDKVKVNQRCNRKHRE